MKIFQILFATIGLAAVTLLSGCIHVEDEGETRTTRTTTTPGGVLAPSTTTVQRTTVEHD